MKKLFFLISIVFSFAQCTQIVTPETPNSTKINFSNLQVGQESRYNRLTARNYMLDSDTTFQNGNDTLILRIESQDSYGFKVSESHTSMKIATFYYYFEVVGDSLFVKPLPQTTEVNSMVLGYTPQKYYLTIANQSLIELNRWWSPKQSPSATAGLGRTQNVLINNILYDKALVYYNRQAVPVDGQYYVKIYSREKGFISFQALGGFAPIGTIYNLL